LLNTSSKSFNFANLFYANCLAKADLNLACADSRGGGCVWQQMGMLLDFEVAHRPWQAYLNLDQVRQPVLQVLHAVLSAG
jgi:hypothetical protein